MMARAAGLLLFSIISMSASRISAIEPSGYRDTASVITADTTAMTSAKISGHPEALFPYGSKSLSESHFTWGADLGSSIDLGGNDQSTFDADVVLGYKNSLIRLIGIGAGIHRAFGNGDNFIPVYVIFRSSFRKKPSPLFLNLKVGYSFNTLRDNATYGDISASIGMGINLAISRRFKSHIILSYGFRHFSRNHKASFNLDVDNVNLAQVCFGVNF